MANHKIDETGNVYGKWKVLGPGLAVGTKTEGYWLCRCECGTEVSVRGSALRAGRSKCCYRCGRPQLPDIVGKRFGDWTILRFLEDTRKVLARCERCGKEYERYYAAIKTGSTTGCEQCALKSVQEIEADKWLQDNCKEYVKEVQLPVQLETGGFPRIDFMIKLNDEWCFLEINGRQHYDDVGEFGRLQRETTDQIKKDWCSTHGIRLFEIRYDQDVNEELTKIFAQDNTVPSLDESL